MAHSVDSGLKIRYVNQWWDQLQFKTWL